MFSSLRWIKLRTHVIRYSKFVVNTTLSMCQQTSRLVYREDGKCKELHGWICRAKMEDKTDETSD